MSSSRGCSTKLFFPAIGMLAACGGSSGGGGNGGGTTGGGTVTPTGVPVAVVPPTEKEASRFLTQATLGPTRAMIGDVVGRGYEKWLDTQFAMPRSGSLWDGLVARGGLAAGPNGWGFFDPAVWMSLITAQDQLRQRVAMALADFLVVSLGGNLPLWPEFAMAAYLDILMDNAFGNYRAILDKITINPAMSSYLSSMNNRKANPAIGSQPDENYARECMQLFSIGLYQLNMDGSIKTSGGAPVETYTQADVSQLARIFTGLIHPDGDWHKADIARTPLIIEPSFNETGSSTFLGKTINGGGMAAIKQALDHIFDQPNVAPFVSKQLIQRLVTSNPTPAYVGRVSAVFADNGKAVRGDLQAVVRAILTDTEARSDAALSSTTAGRLRPPVQRLTAWARAVGATSASNDWAIGDTSSSATGLGQSVGRSPSVFNFFRPGYAPPGSAVSAAGLVAPEFQITNEQSVISYVNLMYRLLSDTVGDVKGDYSSLASKASDAQALVEEVNLIVAAGQLSASSVSTIVGAVQSASSNDARARIAVLLTLGAPEFLTTR